jgi:hypothetical protein
MRLADREDARLLFEGGALTALATSSSGCRENGQSCTSIDRDETLPGHDLASAGSVSIS